MRKRSSLYSFPFLSLVLILASGLAVAQHLQRGLLGAQTLPVKGTPNGAEHPAPPTSLKWYASLAKAHGQDSISLGSSETHDYTPPLAESLKKNQLIKGFAVSHVTDSSDGFKIIQWYTIKVVSKGPDRSFQHSSQAHAVPSAAQTVKADEIVLRIDGGTATIEGVSITQPGPPILDTGQLYLLFLEKDSPNSYTLGFNTEPVPVDQQGKLNIAAVRSTRFSRQLKSYRSYEDIQQSAF